MIMVAIATLQAVHVSYTERSAEARHAPPKQANSATLARNIPQRPNTVANPMPTPPTDSTTLRVARQISDVVVLDVTSRERLQMDGSLTSTDAWCRDILARTARTQ